MDVDQLKLSQYNDLSLIQTSLKKVIIEDSRLFKIGIKTVMVANSIEIVSVDVSSRDRNVTNTRPNNSR